MRAENPAGVAVTLLGLGGIWNSEVVPDSRLLGTAVIGTAFALAGAAYGWRPAWQALGRSRMAALAVLAGLGLLVAATTATAPGRELLAALIDSVPGAGLLRDGHKWLAWWALLLAVLVGFAVDRLQAYAARWGAAGAAVALGPDRPAGRAARPGLGGGRSAAAGGLPGPTTRPSATRSPRQPTGDVLSLPWSGFRAYDWNGGRTSLDPIPVVSPKRQDVSLAETSSLTSWVVDGVGNRLQPPGAPKPDLAAQPAGRSGPRRRPHRLPPNAPRTPAAVHRKAQQHREAATRPATVPVSEQPAPGTESMSTGKDCPAGGGCGRGRDAPRPRAPPGRHPATS